MPLSRIFKQTKHIYIPVLYNIHVYKMCINVCLHKNINIIEPMLPKICIPFWCGDVFFVGKHLIQFYDNNKGAPSKIQE